MQTRSWIPLLLAFTAFGCDAERKIAAPESGAPSAVDAPLAATAEDSVAGAVYTMSNDPAGNAVLMFTRTEDGSLDGPTSFATGGMGTGAGLGSQGALVFGGGSRWLFVVNAGSNDISVFHVGDGDVVLIDRIPSGGLRPVSVTVFHDLLYALNAGGSGNIQGFRIGPSGTLAPIPGSNRALSGSAAAPAQIGFTPDGSRLVVTERATNLLSIYEVDADGAVTDPVPQPSSGTTPFGFGFDQNRTLIVSEAFGGALNASAVSSYNARRGKPITVVSASVPTTQTAACWIAVSGNGRFAYAANAGSNTITGYSVANDGTLSRLDAGVTATTGSGPTELAWSNGSRYLYVLNAGARTISGYRVGADGALEPLAAAGGLPTGTNGLAAR